VEAGRREIADQKRDIDANFPKTKALVSFVLRMNRENIRTPARSIANLEFHHTTDQINEVARKVVAALEQAGVHAINGGAAGFPMEADQWGSKMWLISHKPVAVAAGLGRMQRNSSKVRQFRSSWNRLAGCRSQCLFAADRLQPLP
jgi:hypothetical protein